MCFQIILLKAPSGRHIVSPSSVVGAKFCKAHRGDILVATSERHSDCSNKSHFSQSPVGATYIIYSRIINPAILQAHPIQFFYKHLYQ